jgi:copper chaperone
VDGEINPSRVYNASEEEAARVSETITYRVAGMSCDHCRAAVEHELAAVAGVERVDVDLPSGVVRVHGESLSDPALRAAVDEAGYEVAP